LSFRPIASDPATCADAPCPTGMASLYSKTISGLVSGLYYKDGAGTVTDLLAAGAGVTGPSTSTYSAGDSQGFAAWGDTTGDIVQDTPRLLHLLESIGYYGDGIRFYEETASAGDEFGDLRALANYATNPVWTLPDASGTVALSLSGVLAVPESDASAGTLKLPEDGNVDGTTNFLSLITHTAGVPITGDFNVTATKIPANTAAATTPNRGVIVGAVSNGGSLDNPEELCDLVYRTATNGVTTACVAGSARMYSGTEDDAGADTMERITCGATGIASGRLIEALCTVE